MDVDEFINRVGCGQFQFWMHVWVYLSMLPYSWVQHLLVYGAYNPGWTCEDDSMNMTSRSINQSDGRNTNAINGTGGEPDACAVYDSCSHIEFKDDSETFVTEWGLACDYMWPLTLMSCLYMIGMTIGSYISGPVSDRFGRKRCLVLSVWSILICGIPLIFSTGWVMFTIFHFLCSIGGGALASLSNFYPLEFTPLKWRVASISIPSWNIILASFGVISFFIRDWRSMLILTMVCTVFVLVSVSLWIPESFRWLAVQGRFSKAKSVVDEICRKNGKPSLDHSILDFKSSEGTESEKKVNMRLLFRRRLIARTLSSNAIMFIIAFTYYALYYGIRNLHGNFYVNGTIFFLIPVPLMPLAPILGHKVGRRFGNLILFGFATVLCTVNVLAFFVIDDKDTRGWTIACVALTIAAFIDQAWCMHMSHCAEMYPTSLRGSGFCLLKCTSRIGGIVAPFIIPNRPDQVFMYYVISGVLLLACCFLLFLLPETLKIPMTDTMTQLNGENKREKTNEEDTMAQLHGDKKREKYKEEDPVNETPLV